MVEDEYSVIEEYINSYTKINIKHNVCNNEFKVKPYAFTHNGTRCPICNESKGERSIRKFLDKNNIKYIYQYKYEECKNERILPFDFAVLNNSNEVIYLIEFQGEQHYKPIEHFGGEERFNRQLKNDRIKYKFCKTNNINLIVISYRDNVEDILSRKLIDSIDKSKK